MAEVFLKELAHTKGWMGKIQGPWEQGQAQLCMGGDPGRDPTGEASSPRLWSQFI